MGHLLTYAEVFGPRPEDLVYEVGEVFGASTRQENNPYGPTGQRNRVGGYLEYNLANRRAFVSYFNPLMPGSLVATDLMVLSSHFNDNHPRYRLLPPCLLWPNMCRTLGFLGAVMRATSVTVTIASAYRSSYINRRSDGKPESRHLHFSALDLLLDDSERFRTYLEHYWWERGNNVKLGLGLYASGRTHIDTHTRPTRARWPRGRGHSRREAERRFIRMFGASMTLVP